MVYTLEMVTTAFEAVVNGAGVELTTPVKINSRLTKTLGRVIYCNSTPVAIEFSKRLLETATEESIMDTILHEAAHYIVMKRTGVSHKHDEVFKACCAEIGTKNDGVYHNNLEYNIPEHLTHKYAVFCEEDGYICGYDRKGRTLKELNYCTCPICHKSSLYCVTNW